jgi:hypothetical protein
MSLAQGIAEPPQHRPAPLQAHRHLIPEHLRVIVLSLLGSLHHEYRLGKRRSDHGFIFLRITRAEA